MIYLYISPSCQSCRKTLKWFDDQKIPYTAINILSDKLTREDIFRMLKNSMNGFDDIISKRSKPYLENNLDFDSMRTNELIDFVINNPTILKRPIIVANTLLEVGYNADDIRTFIPQERRTYAFANCNDCTTKNPATCDYANDALILVNEIKRSVNKNASSNK